MTAPTGLSKLHEKIEGLRAQAAAGTLTIADEEKPPVETPEEEKPAEETPEDEKPGEKPAEEDKGAEGEEGAEGAEGEEAAEEEEPEADDAELVVHLPGRKSGETVPFIAPDKETADDLRRLSNDVMRRSEFNRRLSQVETQRAELDYVDQYLRTDPAGFVVETIPKHLYAEIAKLLLAHEGVAEEIQPTIEKWNDNPEARRADRNEMVADAQKRKGQFEKTFEAREGERAVARRTELVVDELAGVVTDDRQRNRFINDALRDVEDHLRESKRSRRSPGRMDVNDIVDIIADRLEGIGITPEDAKAAFDERNPRPLTRARPVGKRAKEFAARQEEARQVGKKLVRAGEARRRAAVVPSGGAGAPTTGRPQAPKGQGIKERIAWARQALTMKRA